jgi:uncharacterized protein YecT (DUF1311 family)
MNRFDTLMNALRILAVLSMAYWCISAEAQTQSELTKASCARLKESEARLLTTYERAVERNRPDKNFVRKFAKAQQAWRAYREAYLESVYPSSNKNEYGTVFEACRCELVAKLNEVRVRQLEGWTIGIEEGDVCIGSRAVKR